MKKARLGDGLSDEEAYKVKRDWLSGSYGEALEPLEFYRSLYPEGTFEGRHPQGYDYSRLPAAERRPNGIVTEILPDPTRTRQTRRWVVPDDLRELKGFMGTGRFGLMAPIGYSGAKRDLRHAYTYYAMAFDLDEPDIPAFFDMAAGGAQPQPTYTVLSGHGLHLYYQFEDPQPLYPRNVTAYQELKRALIPQIWCPATSAVKPQYQGINQGFRLVGAASKLGPEYPVAAWRTGAPTSAGELADYLVDDKVMADVLSAFGPSSMTWREAREKYPEWAARKEGREPAPRWHVRPALYEWWKTQARKATYGHRYYFMMCLAVYARKCDIPEAVLRRDAWELKPLMNALHTQDPFTDEDIKAAMKAYDDKYQTMSRDAVSQLTAIPITPNRRNHRKQAIHLARARAVQNLDDPEGNWRGRPSKEGLVRDYIAGHPDRSVTEIARALNVSRPTVYKYRGLPAAD